MDLQQETLIQDNLGYQIIILEDISMIREIGIKLCLMHQTT